MPKLGFSILFLSLASTAQAEQIGEVSTTFQWMGPNDKIVVEVFQDPDIPGVACYLSRAKTGGFSGAVGLAEDTSDASIACRQVGPVTLPERVVNGKDDGDRVFKKRTSLFTKKMQVVRFYDAPRNTLAYLTYSDRIIEGSPKNSISVVVIKPWVSTPAKVNAAAPAVEEAPAPQAEPKPQTAQVTPPSSSPDAALRVDFGGGQASDR